MRFCADHWQSLRDKVAEAGMADLVAQGGEAAVRNLASTIQDGPSIETFDPLMSAHMAIMGNAIEMLGLRIMAGDLCPICEMNKVHAETCKGPPCQLPLDTAFDAWLDYAVHDAQEAYEQLLKEGRPQ